MTINEAIKLTDALYPGNRFDNEMKTLWLSEIDGKIFEEIIYPSFDVTGPENEIVEYWKEGGEWKNSKLRTATEDKNSELENLNPLNQCFCKTATRPVGELRPYRYVKDQLKELIAPDRFCDVYTHYLLAKMHAADSEIEDYNNEVLLYQAAFTDFAGWHIRSFKRQTPDRFSA